MGQTSPGAYGRRWDEKQHRSGRLSNSEVVLRLGELFFQAKLVFQTECPLTSVDRRTESSYRPFFFAPD